MKNLPFLFLLILPFLAAAKPNIIFILVDDMGYGDIACYGAPDVRTPHLDTLAGQGVRFTQFYANGAECTPTRTAFLTGRYAQRAGGLECAIGTGNVGRYDDAIRLAEKGELGLPARQSVLAKPLKKQGYATAIFGKWHLGYERKFLPHRFGFDESFYFLGGNVDYFTHKELSPLPALYRGDKPVEREGYMTHLITEDALDFIDRRKAQPFFLYLPYSTPHFPFQAPGDEGKVFTKENWLEGSRETYVAMLEDMDTQVGRIMNALKSAKIANNTLLVFASDHGGMGPSRNAPFRDKKGTLFEGGIRTTCIARWPGKLPVAKTSSRLTLTFDLTASFLAAAGAVSPLALDGIDVFADIANGKLPEARIVGWRARRGDRTWRAIRADNLKYVSKIENNAIEEYLFDIAKDPTETSNLIESHPDETKQMLRLLGAWEDEVQHQR
jgi:arylsulfatase A-like enzyme